MTSEPATAAADEDLGGANFAVGAVVDAGRGGFRTPRVWLDTTVFAFGGCAVRGVDTDVLNACAVFTQLDHR